ncbi:MAG: porin [Thermodesulfobacteriota bacterium]
MKSVRGLIVAIAAVAAVAISLPTPAGAFLLGEPTDGYKLKLGAESDIKLRVRLQPRLDFGDIRTNRAGTAYSSHDDFYSRRTRFETSGHITEKLKFNVTFAADKWEKKSQDEEIYLYYAYLDYKFSPALSIRFGKHKLPYSRVSRVSSSKQLLVERPASTEKAKKLFGNYHPYNQPALKVEGRAMHGLMGYALAVAEGWEDGETIRSGRSVDDADLLYAGRLELSPPGWVEGKNGKKGKKSDAHLGEGRHLTFGLSLASQDSIEYRENGYEEDRELFGFDVSFHRGPFTLQFEYIRWEEDSDDPAVDEKEPEGWYVQAGYFFERYALEPAVRYEVYDQDTDSSSMEEKTTTVGVNWYAKGHSVKLGMNWVHTSYDRNAGGRLARDDDRDVFQVQGQFYF